MVLKGPANPDPGNNDASISPFKYRYNGKEYQDEIGLNMTAMDYRQYDNAIGRFNGIDALAEMQYSNTPYHFGYGNPVYWADPSGLVSPGFLATLWNNSYEKSTTWHNYGGMFVTGSSSSSTGFKGVDEADNMFFDNLMKPVTVKYGRSSDGILMQDHVYQYGKFYDQLRSDRSSAKWDDFQSTLDGIGMIPVLGEIADGGNAIVSVFRGDYTGAGLSALAMVPFAGNLATVVKIQKHHIIPKAVYKKMGSELSDIMKLNGGFNLKNIPNPFHGNHPQYSNFVTDRLMDMKREGILSPGSIQALQKDLNGMINQAYDNYKATGENLNDYFRKLNGN